MKLAESAAHVENPPWTNFCVSHGVQLSSTASSLYHEKVHKPYFSALMGNVKQRLAPQPELQAAGLFDLDHKIYAGDRPEIETAKQLVEPLLHHLGNQFSIELGKEAKDKVWKRVQQLKPDNWVKAVREDISLVVAEPFKLKTSSSPSTTTPSGRL
eukprot:TRINITY_DN408_c1_g2_i8.p2 TRINITY_DN408_c1_g2~~TRINITY_DN408_c1_g2_i8.p2  ORF type:complete len:156 (-),score=19.95 TRINITY_DN408_c1_g2_i8:1044-1511(-)